MSQTSTPTLVDTVDTVDTDGLHTPSPYRPTTITINSKELSEACEHATNVLKDAEGTCQALEDKNEQGKDTETELSYTIGRA